MESEVIKQFTKRVNKSRSSIIRFYNANPSLKAETTMKGKNRCYPIEHARYFDSEVMFDENKRLKIENELMKQIIDNLANR